MQNLFEWQASDIEPVLAIALTTIGFIIYWFLGLSDSIRAKFVKKYGEEKTRINFILFQKYIGVLFLGIVPTIIALIFLPYSFSEYGLNFKNLLPTLYWTLGLGAIIIPMNLFAARKPKNYVVYPHIRAEVWNSGLIIKNAISWILYLFAYEFLFRGILLFACIPVLGVWPAIAVNITIYSCTHIPKGLTEAVAAIPFGIILCLITISTGNIWVAVFAHIFLALSNDYVALYFNPKTRIIK
ncbi:lysostaphin resistance A-like protein [Bacteroidota bacterium]